MATVSTNLEQSLADEPSRCTNHSQDLRWQHDRGYHCVGGPLAKSARAPVRHPMGSRGRSTGGVPQESKRRCEVVPVKISLPGRLGRGAGWDQEF